MSELHGYAYIVESADGRSFLYGSTFRPSKGKAHKALEAINRSRSEQGWKPFKPVSLEAVRLTTEGVEQKPASEA